MISGQSVSKIFNFPSKWFYPTRILIVFFLGLAIYYQTFSYGFVFDDIRFIVNNHNIRDFKDIHYIWAGLPKTRLIGIYSFALNYHFCQLDPRGYHVFNFLVHLITTLLVWVFARKLFKITGWSSADTPLQENAAFLIALLFLVHPGQTQAVSYISQRFESIAALFYISCMICYIYGRVSSIRIHQVLFFLAAVCFGVMGIFTKETPVTIPLMLIVLEGIVLKDYPIKFKNISRQHIYILVSVLGALLILVLAKLLNTGFHSYLHYTAPSDSHDGEIITTGKYVLTQMRVFLTFLRLLIFPIHQNVDYDYPLSTGLWAPPLTLVGLGAIGLIIYLIGRLRKFLPLIAFGLAWVLVTFAINLVPRGNVIFEHKLYLISFGFFLAVVCSLSTLIKNRQVLYVSLIAWIIMLACISFNRNQVWKNEVTLWSDAAAHSPYKARPYFNRAMANLGEGRVIEAKEDFYKAVQLNPNYAFPYYGLGLIDDMQKHFDQALVDYSKAIDLQPGNFRFYNNRAIVYFELGKSDMAIDDLNKSITLDYFNEETYNNLGSIYYQQGKYNQAIVSLGKAIELDPHDAYALRLMNKMRVR